MSEYATGFRRQTLEHLWDIVRLSIADPTPESLERAQKALDEISRILHAH